MWAERDPDGIAPDGWQTAAAYYGEAPENTVRCVLYPGATYHDYYDLSVEAAIYRAARESVDWKPGVSPSEDGWVRVDESLLLYSLVAGYRASLLDKPRLFEYVRQEWSRCDGPGDGLRLLTEALRGCGSLSLRSDLPDVPDGLSLPDAYDTDGELSDPMDRPPSSLPADDWGDVFAVENERRYAWAKRAHLLRELADERASTDDLTAQQAVRDVAEQYVDAQRTAVAVDEALEFSLDFDESDRLVERLAGTWGQRPEADQWLDPFAVVLLTHHLRTRADMIERVADRYSG